ncbi:MAG: efflux RND transporter periplasmic adaptor subunit [Candidatus Eisenbacteria bacterium]
MSRFVQHLHEAAGLAVAILLLASAGCGQNRAAESEPDERPDSLIHLPAAVFRSGEVQVEEVRLQGLADTVVVSGTIEPIPTRTAHVSSRVTGTVVSVTAVVGDRVGAGQVLATLYSPEFLAAQSDFLLAHERLDNARLSGAPDTTALANIALSSRQRLSFLGAAPADLAEVEHRALVEKTHKALNELRLRSPIAGVLTEVEATIGRHIGAGSDLFGVADLSRVWAVVDAYERDLGRLRVGQQAAVSASAFASRLFAGRIASLEGTVKEETRTLKVRIETPNPALELKPGMFVTARIVTGEVRPAIVTSEGAVQAMDDRDVVFVAVSDTTFVARPVEVRKLGGNRVEITRGLRAGERVAVQGAFLIRSQASKSQLGDD